MISGPGLSREARPRIRPAACRRHRLTAETATRLEALTLFRTGGARLFRSSMRGRNRLAAEALADFRTITLSRETRPRQRRPARRNRTSRNHAGRRGHRAGRAGTRTGPGSTATTLTRLRPRSATLVAARTVAGLPSTDAGTGRLAAARAYWAGKLPRVHRTGKLTTQVDRPGAVTGLLRSRDVAGLPRSAAPGDRAGGLAGLPLAATGDRTGDRARVAGHRTGPTGYGRGACTLPPGNHRRHDLGRRPCLTRRAGNDYRSRARPLTRRPHTGTLRG
ncbi:hypothetical protein GCM10010172_69800 [Paractinoplanes ferrugineus]|uniref:Uncharacterized protein n=1 Tax=Paractinoplanes ferrugineus TaxID=113564 RepID=A0A919J867_9ACTN|nr:hypothetical protein Afe05nite_41910 [Actinoplanes ferrugineus]